MKKLLTVLCILVLALCLTGTALAEDVGCDHPDARIEHDIVNCWEYCPACDMELWRCRHHFNCDDDEQTNCASCGASAEEVNINRINHTGLENDSWWDGDVEYHQPYCGKCDWQVEEAHPTRYRYAYASESDCAVTCDECDFYQYWGHVAQCSSDDSACLHCGAEGVIIGSHEGHPDNLERYEFEDEDSHRAYCIICGDDLGVRVHIKGCSGAEKCYYCGAEGVNFVDWDHFAEFDHFDKTRCYWKCACGEINYDVWHGIYCDSEDKNTCAECGNNVEKDGIIISDTWHDTRPGHSDTHCWTKCKACGYFEYFAEHYIPCYDKESTHCDNCWQTEEDGIILTLKHTGLDHDVWEEDGIEWHRQVCWACGYEGEAHAADLTYTAVDGDPNKHRGSCPDCKFDWTENHYAVCGEEKCVDCGAENVTFAYHIDHRDNSECYVYGDAVIHKKYCGICGDDWGWEEHVADCSDYDPDSMTGTCFYCGKENVNVIDVKHDAQYVKFDEELCYYRCACGEEAYNWQHVVYCDSEDKNTCVGCGKNTEADGIVIGLIWHEEEHDHDENECWTFCLSCGEELYRGPHYFSCSGSGQNCAYCDASSEEVKIEEFRHADIDMFDLGDGWHDPWCLNCGEHLSETHEFSLYFKYGGYEICRAYCETCGYLGNWGHQGQCGESDEHTWCIRCGAEDVKVYDHGNHISADEVSCIDQDYHLFYCGGCGDEHYSDEHKASVGSDKTFGTCAVCGAENVNLHGPVTEKEYIEDGIRVFITYHEDGSMHIDYSDAETGEYYGWENYENWQDKQPTEWERRSNVVYEEEDIYSFEFDADWGNGTKKYRISNDQLLYEAGFDGEIFYEDIFDENDRIWNCTHWEDAEHTRLVRTIKCNEDWEWMLEHYYEYDMYDVPGSMLVHIHEYGEEVAQEFYTSVNDTEPSQWEHYSSIWYETDDGNRTAIHRDFLTNEGDFGTMTFQITGEDWFFIYEDRYMGDGIGHMETNWNDSERCYHQTIRENDRMVYSCNKTVDWELINEANYEYFGSIGPVVTEREWRDDGTVHEYVYTNPNDRNVYEDRLYVDDTGYLQHSFHVHGSTVEFGQSVLYLPKGLSTIESEAFVGISARIVVLPENVTSIAGNAFSPDTVLLVPNEEIALLAQQAGYAWFFF